MARQIKKVEYTGTRNRTPFCVLQIRSTSPAGIFEPNDTANMGQARQDAEIVTLRHFIEVVYPVLGLGEPDEVALVWFEADNQNQRYEPRPLIDRAACTAHAFRDSMNETSHYSLTPATTVRSMDDIDAVAPSGAVFDLQSLIRHMDFIQLCDGKTIMKVVTCHKLEDPDRSERRTLVRIRCDTEFRFEGGDRMVREALYEFRIEDLIHRPPILGSMDWFLNMGDLIYRRTDRADLHVENRLRDSPNLSDLPGKWKEYRHPIYLVPLSRMAVDPVVGEQLDCRICWEGPDSPGSNSGSPKDIVLLDCNAHKFHKDCVHTWSRTRGPEQSKCPLCRVPIYKENDINLMYLFWDRAHGGAFDVEFMKDDRFNTWENFERSCMDIDQHAAENSTHMLYFTENLIMSSFRMFEKFAKKERASSTPHHLQIVRCPDFRLLEDAITQVSRQYDRRTHQQRYLYNRIMYHLFWLSNNNYMLNGVVSLLSPDDTTERESNGQAWGKNALRPGYFEFAQRTVRRMLEFIRLRQCDCDSNVFHPHGDGHMYFYNPHKLKHRYEGDVF